MKKKINQKLKEYYNSNLKDIIYFICILCFACMVYLFIQNKEEKSIDERAEEEINAANEFVQHISFKSVSSNRLNDMTVQVFLRELVGNDYTLLIELFSDQELKNRISTMTEYEIIEFAAAVGSKIKENMTLKSALVIQNEEISETENHYTIELNLQSENEIKKKIIDLTIINGEITTEINDLF